MNGNYIFLQVDDILSCFTFKVYPFLSGETFSYFLTPSHRLRPHAGKPCVFRVQHHQTIIRSQLVISGTKPFRMYTVHKFVSGFTYFSFFFQSSKHKLLLSISCMCSALQTGVFYLDNYMIFWSFENIYFLNTQKKLKKEEKPTNNT